MNKQDNILIGTIVLLVFLFLFVTKTIFSGYHFVDDHEIIKINSELKTSSLTDVTKNWVKVDLNSTRFRPMYYIHRVVVTKLFGDNFFLWSLYNGILCCIALVTFYAGMRYMKFTIMECIVFLVITFVGPQSAVWWRLGPGEGLGMVFLGFSFYFMSKSGKEINYLLNSLLFILFLILASLTKESFLIIIPAMVFFKIVNEKFTIWPSLKESVYHNLLLIVPLVVMVSELYIIKFYVGISYSGLDAGVSESISGISSAFLHFLKTYLNLVIAGIIIMTISIIRKKQFLKLNYFSIIFFALVFIPNIILYSKSGLVERYLLPSSFGLGYMVISLLNRNTVALSGFKNLVPGLIIFSFLPSFFSVINEGVKFSTEGLNTNRLLSEISSNLKTGTDPLVVVDPVQSYEASVSLKNYLFYKNGIDLFGYSLVNNNDLESNKALIEGWRFYFDKKQIEDIRSKPGILIFLDNQLVKPFFEKSNLAREDYFYVDMGKSPYALLKNGNNSLN